MKRVAIALVTLVAVPLLMAAAFHLHSAPSRTPTAMRQR